MKRDLKPFLCRLEPEVVRLLDEASKAQKKSRAEIINDAVKVHLSRTGDLNERLNRVVTWR